MTAPLIDIHKHPQAAAAPLPDPAGRPRARAGEERQRIKALKNVTINEPFFMGHFPHRPVMPGVLMLEALAQTAALLSFESMGQEPDADTVVYFVGIDGARFKRVVEPGDQLILEASIDRARGGIYKYKTRASVDGETAVEAELMCTMRKVA
jgi:3-hydroxyacyl-[acyl-carrier-protein] dehydratase